MPSEALSHSLPSVKPMVPRKLGHLSSASVVRIGEGFVLSTKEERLDDEARRRLVGLRKACKPLARELRDATIAAPAEASIRALDAVIDTRWSVLRNVLRELARLGASVPLGAEAATTLATYFPQGLAFLDFPAQLQLQHARALLRAFDAAALSPALHAIVTPLLDEIRARHVDYERALDAKLVRVVPERRLGALRKVALEALEAFVAYVGVMAYGRDDHGKERAARILAPLESLLASQRVPRARGQTRRAPTMRARSTHLRKPGNAPMPIGDTTVVGEEASLRPGGHDGASLRVDRGDEAAGTGDTTALRDPAPRHA